MLANETSRIIICSLWATIGPKSVLLVPRGLNNSAPPLRPVLKTPVIVSRSVTGLWLGSKKALHVSSPQRTGPSIFISRMVIDRTQY
jgi:hypothetical protein